MAGAYLPGQNQGALCHALPSALRLLHITPKHCARTEGQAVCSAILTFCHLRCSIGGGNKHVGGLDIQARHSASCLMGKTVDGQHKAWQNISWRRWGDGRHDAKTLDARTHPAPPRITAWTSSRGSGGREGELHHLPTFYRQRLVEHANAYRW